ncbi:hypothetical protein CR513_08412, partial [Mucuna pruriens]
MSGSSISYRSHKHGNNERLERHGRHKRGKDKPKRDNLESVKCKELREKFVPTYYARELYVKLQRLYQWSKGVEEYFKEMEMCMMRA